MRSQFKPKSFGWVQQFETRCKSFSCIFAEPHAPEPASLLKEPCRGGFGAGSCLSPLLVYLLVYLLDLAWVEPWSRHSKIFELMGAAV